MPNHIGFKVGIDLNSVDQNLRGKVSVSGVGFIGKIVFTGFTSSLFLDAAFFQDHPAIHGLTHVIDGEEGDLACHQRFHFHTRLPSGLDGCTAKNRRRPGRIGIFQRKLNSNSCQGQWMAQGYQITRFLGGLDACDARDPQDIAFLGRT